MGIDINGFIICYFAKRMLTNQQADDSTNPGIITSKSKLLAAIGPMNPEAKKTWLMSLSTILNASIFDFENDFSIIR